MDGCMAQCGTRSRRQVTLTLTLTLADTDTATLTPSHFGTVQTTISRSSCCMFDLPLLHTSTTAYQDRREARGRACTGERARGHFLQGGMRQLWRGPRTTAGRSGPNEQPMLASLWGPAGTARGLGQRQARLSRREWAGGVFGGRVSAGASEARGLAAAGGGRAGRGEGGWKGDRHE